MDIINEKLLIKLYSEYINDNQYVYYKDRNIIIIMKKLTDDSKCLSIKFTLPKNIILIT